MRAVNWTHEGTGLDRSA